MGGRRAELRPGAADVVLAADLPRRLRARLHAHQRPLRRGVDGGRPVHIAGRGYPSADGTQVNDADIRAFVDGAVAAGVIGGSVYDYASTRTRTAWWPLLTRLNGL